MTASRCLEIFIIEPSDMQRMVQAVLESHLHIAVSKRNIRYIFTSDVCNSMGFATLEPWRIETNIFGKLVTELSEISWECIDTFIELTVHIITGYLRKSFTQPLALLYANEIRSTFPILARIVGFLDGSCIHISWLKTKQAKRAVYIRHNRTHSQ